MRLLAMAASIVFWLGLAAWIGALLTAGIAAGCVFGTLPDLGVQLSDYAAFDADRHGGLAAGMVMEKVFWIVDLVQFVAAPLTIAGLLVMLGCGWWRQRRGSAIVMTLCVIAASATLAYHVVALAPPMNRELRAYWSAARAGDADEALTRRANFEQMHPQAELLLQARLLLLLSALVAAAVAAAPRTAKISSLPKPALLKP